jgi:hypothetical protein
LCPALLRWTQLPTLLGSLPVLVIALSRFAECSSAGTVRTAMPVSICISMNSSTCAIAAEEAAPPTLGCSVILGLLPSRAELKMTRPRRPNVHRGARLLARSTHRPTDKLHSVSARSDDEGDKHSPSNVTPPPSSSHGAWAAGGSAEEEQDESQHSDRGQESVKESGTGAPLPVIKVTMHEWHPMRC